MQSDKADSRNQQQSIDFNSFYPHMFPLSSSVSPSDCSFEDDMATENRLNQARLALEYQQLYNRYAMCLSHLQESLKEVQLLRESNETISITNADLVKRLNLLQNCLLPPPSISSLSSDFSCLGLEGDSPTSVIEQRNKHGPERVTLPKSISVRSSGYVKTPPQRIGGSRVPSRSHRVNSIKNPGLSGSQRVCVPAAGGEKENDAVELEVYNQGMFKTELCNKWQETGACPYGENCQFAHGITELRPVIRHPRYKTEVCRMVLAGDNCPYGHRCHFRHSLTEEEKMLGPLRLNELNR